MCSELNKEPQFKVFIAYYYINNWCYIYLHKINIIFSLTHFDFLFMFFFIVEQLEN